MDINGEITFGNLLTAASVLVSAAALAYGWRNDRQLRRMEYADRVRRAAGITAAVFDRWQILVQQFFDGIQPLLIEVDELNARGEETTRARLALVRGIFAERAAASRRIADERIETAYVDLYGYDPRSYGLFLGTMARLREIDDRVFAQIIELARGTSPTPPTRPEDPSAPDVPTTLRSQCHALYRAHQEEAGAVVTAFHAQMLRLVQASDGQLLGHRVELDTAPEALPAREG